MWRHDAQRSGYTSAQVPLRLQHCWTYQGPAPRPAWPASQDKLQFDVAPHAVVARGVVYITSSESDRVTACDLNSGIELWRFYAQGPIRFAPAEHDGRVFVVADDGYLYCLDAASGELDWKFLGGPRERWTLGNGRLISSWPARGGPVAVENKVYFAASIWPFMGIFIHCLDAATGAVVWTNSGDGMNLTVQPHGAPAFATVAPQGHLVVSGDRLLVPGGRSTPAMFDRHTGRLLSFAYDGKRGSHQVFADGIHYFVDQFACDLQTGQKSHPETPLLATPDTLLYLEGRRLQGFSLTGQLVSEKKIDRLGKETTTTKFVRSPVFDVELDEPCDRVPLQAESRVVVLAGRQIRIYELSSNRAELPALPASCRWNVAGDVVDALVADGRLLLTTRQGQVICLGPPERAVAGAAQNAGAGSAAGAAALAAGEELRHSPSGPAVANDVAAPRPAGPTAADRALVRALRELADPRTLGNTARNTARRRQDRSPAAAEAAAELPPVSDQDQPQRDGYTILWGPATESFLQAWLEATDGQLIIIDSDASRIAQLRRQLDQQGCYGRRVSGFHLPAGLPSASEVAAHDRGKGILDRQPVTEEGRWATPLPSYLASTVIVPASETALNKDACREIYRWLRPYGGMACFATSRAQHETLQAVVEQLRTESDEFADAQWQRVGEQSILRRSAGLPGAGQWTHQYADAGQSGVSHDTLVKAPLGILWFGGPSNDSILPRHGHGPAPQVAGGRIVIEGPNLLRALDAFTGRLLWEREFVDLGKYYDNTSHFPGASEIGSNYVTLADRVYVVYGSTIVALDAATGETVQEFRLRAERGASPPFGFLAVWNDVLVATSTPLDVIAAPKDKASRVDSLNAALSEVRYASASKMIVAFDRHSGRELWRRTAEYNFRHNSLALGGGKVFCVDRFSEEKLKALARRGVQLETHPQLYALDVVTGNVAWSHDQDVFGTFLNYSEDHDLLLQGGSLFRDRAYDEIGQGMVAYRGATGAVLWQDAEVVYNGPCLLWRDKIITNGNGGFSLDLLTGKRTGWTYQREYGCNTAFGCQNLLTYRSGAAGFYDLLNDSGTGNWGGFRSSCTNNLIPAEGLLCAPDYTRTCNCAYQNQSSLALIHQPELDYWTFGGPMDKGKIAVNFGAPGDRRDPSGTLWVEYPVVGGKSPDPRITTSPGGREIDADKSKATAADGGLAEGKLNSVRYFSSRVAAADLPWIYASSLSGVREITIAHPRPGRPVHVRLYFAELEADLAATRRFGIRLQSREVEQEFNIAQAAGGAFRGVVRDYPLHTDEQAIHISLVPCDNSETTIAGLEIVTEFTDAN